MSKIRPKSVSYSQISIRSSFIELIEVASRFRNQIVATITITALLVTIFQAEVLTANFFGYSSSRALLDSFPREAKVVLAATTGPFIHQGPRHLTDNLGILLIVGAYLECEYNRSSLYTFYLGVGYLAAWAPLMLGFTGSVGASGVTYGLSTWLFVHSTSRLLEMIYDGALDRRMLHIAPATFGLGATINALMILQMLGGADDITHFFGGFLGLFLGAKFTLEYHNIEVFGNSVVEV